jgi:hypothetical protein
MSDDWKPFPVTPWAGTTMTSRGRWRFANDQGDRIEIETSHVVTFGCSEDPPTRAERNSPAYVRAKRARR